MPGWSTVGLSQEGTNEVDKDGLSRGVNVCCHKQGRQVKCGDV